MTLTTPEGRGIRLVGCYHVSPHNTFTGRLTPAMLDAVLLSLRRTRERRAMQWPRRRGSPSVTG